ncbi:GAF domain-containing protein [Chryseolinea lacunae]|uniref:GAF domain-containing protein n=1 Tax=Chryseolinea lacunae TaxID=2801331 RepID=A0ABS1KR88_9BACT|nr:GAF domain-containing protein [Chryseolinea lacunae]MBL0741732.1 GAF domain-containing protein [Chryseolinea lacunae]
MQHSTLHSNFPFRSILSLRLLIEYWERNIAQGAVPDFVKGMMDYLDTAPELRLPIEDFSIVEKHKTFINFLMTAVMPPANQDTERIAAILPFQFTSVYSTRAFDRTLDMKRIEEMVTTNFPDNHMTLGKTVKACLLILEKFYGVKMDNDKPILFTLRNPESGLDRVYKVEISHQFCDIVCNTTPTPIEKHVLKFLMEKIYDVDLWLQYIHPEDYEFHGFIEMRLIDVTEQEMLSSIKYDLLKKDAVVNEASFSAIQHKLRSLFNIPEMKLGIAYMDPSNNIILNNSSASGCWRSLAERPTDDKPCEDYTGSVYERSWIEKRYVTVENLKEYPFPSKIEESLLANGINNILLAPLIEEGETIGMLELATPTAGKLNPVSAHKVENVLPMFTAAVKRVKEEMSTEVRALIQEECTAIHSSVQWRFFEAGVKLMNLRRRDEKALMDEIVFKDVYPLFGLSDVRNSSIERSAAIQKDFQQNLKLAKDLLQKIYEQKKLPLVEEVIFKTEEQQQKINRGLASGDESNVIEFLKTEIHPLIQHFEEDAELKKHIVRYRAHLDPVFGVVYKRRKAFEEDLALINKTIGDHLDEAEVSAQEMFPHYFEKYKTDGVEFTLYVGSSLVKGRAFDTFYLKNFHLWQLVTMVEIYRKMEALKPKLKNNLDITQLMLVYDQPISIRFRADEKRFDVDGAYDIRYEIVKKRIDKAHVKTTGERLTQPGKIAVVYNQAKVEDEYRRYFHYLAGKKLITGDIEELELEELPGANGLRALRITLTDEQKEPALQKDDLLKDIEDALRLH